MELTPFLEKLIEQAPVVGVLMYLVVNNNKRLDEIVDRCSTQLETLTIRLLNRIDPPD